MNKFRFGFIYLGLIPIFSVIYQLAWSFDPESFAVNKELNLSPIAYASKVAFDQAELDPEQLITPPTELDDLQNTVLNMLSKGRDIARSIDKFETDIEVLKEKIKNGRLQFEERVNANLQKLEKDILSPLQKNEELKKKEIQAIEEQIKSSKTDYYLKLQLEESLSKKRIELIEWERKKLEKELEIAREYLSGSEQIYDEITQDLKDEFIRLDKELVDQEDILEKLKNDHQEYSFELEMFLINQYTERAELLNLIDFFYYSIGISTTTTFGDIMANSRSVRLLVSIQLLLSVLCLGLFTNELTQHYSSEKSSNGTKGIPFSFWRAYFLTRK